MSFVLAGSSYYCLRSSVTLTIAMHVMHSSKEKQFLLDTFSVNQHKFLDFPFMQNVGRTEKGRSK